MTIAVDLGCKAAEQTNIQTETQACPGKSVVRWPDRPAMTIAVDLGRKAAKQTNKQNLK